VFNYKYIKHIAFAFGSLLAAGLATIWYLIGSGQIPLPLPITQIFSVATLLVCPASFLLTGVNSGDSLSPTLVLLLLTVFLINGLFYMAVATIVQKVGKYSTRSPNG
jgi:hypothetical protein